MEQTLSFEKLDQMLGNHAPFLISLSDGLEEELRIVIAPARAGEPGAALPELDGFDEATRRTLGEILSSARPIDMDGERPYEIRFEEYILYQVRDESYCSFDPGEVRRGRYLITFEDSKLLSYLGVATHARRFDDGSFYPGKWKHYGIYTQNHVIDVISHCPPAVSPLAAE